MKKVLSLILALVMLIGLLPMTALASESEEVAENPWNGRSAVFVGDSITAGSGTTNIYYQYLNQTLGFSSVTAMGVAGSCISAASDYGQANQPLINRYQNIPSADLIVIFMGTNDYGHETPLGSVDDTQDGSFDGALNEIIPALVTKHPSSKIVFVTPLHRYGFGISKILGTQFTSDSVPNGVGATLGDYVEALKTVCANNGVSVIDLHTECTLDPADSAVRSNYMPDGLHPNAAGHELIAGIMESHIRGYSPMEEAPETETEPEEETDLVYGNKFASGFAQQNRASSRVNQYLKAGTVITLKDPNLFQWACTKTIDENSCSNLGYFPDGGWSDKETAVVETDGWVGFVFKYRDETQSFDLTKPLSDYITIEALHTHTEVVDAAKAPTCTGTGLTAGSRCETCGEILVMQEVVSATGHTYENGICTSCGNAQNTVCEGHLLPIPQPFCCNTNLWALLDPVNEYYTANGWGNSSKSIYSVTFPVTAGDRIYATSFQAAGENGFTENGVRITWFNETGVLESLHRDTVYAEFAANGYITVPEGAVAVNIPMIDNADTWEIYILNREHNYNDGICGSCGAEYLSSGKYEGKVISILGDSISTFAGYIPEADGFNLEHLSRYPDADRIPDVTAVEQTWWMQVITELGAKLGINDSWRGATVSGAAPVTTGTTGENAAMSNLTRIQNLGANGTPDVILFYGGTNDLAHVSKVGSFDPDEAPVAVDLTTKKWDNLADAYVHTLLRLRHYYPDAEIIAMLPTYTKSYYSADKLAQANAVLAQICDHYGVTYVDLRYCGISANNLPDGIHPGAAGMDYITEAVVDALLNECEMEAGENIVYSVTHKLTGAESSLGYYKGITHGKSFVTTITGENLTVTVTMGGVDITDAVYANGVVAIEEVTGDIVITAKGRVKTIYEDHLQQLPEEICAGTNLWATLEHDAQYYTVNGWGIHSSGTVYSVTIPVSDGDRIFATSFGAAGKNGSSINGIRVTWFDKNGVLESVSADKIYAEFFANGYITVPEGAVAVNIPMWKISDDNEIYILNREHCYENSICTACGAYSWDTDGDGILEILAIGNSFSVDALEYAYQIAQDLGIEEIILGNLYIGGCSLQTHATNAAGDLAKYTYYYNDNGTWKTTSNYKISTALESRSWDFVSLQQASNYSGVESTYNEDLTDLIAYVQERSDAKLVWHMTWAYQQDSTHSAFPTYGKNQMTMYNAIVSAVQNKIVTNSNFDLIVPNGTAVQNSRTSLLGDTATRDGYHMSYDYGRYLTGLLFIKTVTGLSVDNIAYAPSGVDAEEMAIAIESVNNAAVKPFAVTQSAYVEEKPEIPDEGYILLKPELYKGAYWHSINADHYNTLVTDASNSKYFFATIRFTRETLPVGSIIILEDGWQYRPEGWITDTVQSSRADTTTESYVVVTEEWWGNYTIRGFNISKVGLPSLTNVIEEEVRAAFRIYVPEVSHSHKNENGVCTLCGEITGPIIVTQPANAEAAMGERFCVTVEAEGEGLKYQWYFRNTGTAQWYKSSVKDNTYDDVMTTARAGREVYCVITDALGNTVTTDIAKLIRVASEELAITKQPTNSEALLGETFCVTVDAKGEGLKYQWYYRNAGSNTWNKSGVRDNTYDDVMTTARAGREVYCVITDAFGNSVTTNTVKLIRVIEELAITKQPVDGEAKLGETYCVSVEAKGEGLKYQWYFRNAGSDTWYKSSVRDNTYDDVMTTARAGREVYCVITDTLGNTVTTDTVKLIRIPVKLEITSQPTDATAVFDEMFCATVKAKGEGLTYQWYYRNAGSDTWHKSGVRDNTYDDIMTKARNGREIYCVITDMWGNSVTTDIVKLTAVPKMELKLLGQSYESAAMGEHYCVTVNAQGEGLTYQWYFRNAGSEIWYKSGVRDNTYDDVMTKARANREVYCVITDAFGNQIVTEVVTLAVTED